MSREANAGTSGSPAMLDPLFVVRVYSFKDATEEIVAGFKVLDRALDRAREKSIELAGLGVDQFQAIALDDDGVRRIRGEDMWISITTHDRPPVSAALDREDYVHCAAREDVTRDRLGLMRSDDVMTWCGRRAWMEFNFVDATHAIINGAQEGRLQLCPACSKAISEALDQGTAD